MNKTKGIYRRFVIVCIILLASCATTTLTGDWRDESFTGTITRVMVIGVSESPTNRNIFEDEFVRQLKTRGVDAVASYTMLPYRLLSNKAAVAATLKKTRMEMVIFTRLVDKKTVQTYVPGQVYAVPNYYYRWGTYYEYVQSPGRIVENNYAYAETNLYYVKDERLIWSARSETLISGTTQQITRAFVKVMIEKLSADLLIR